MRRVMRSGGLLSSYLDTLPPGQAALARAVSQLVSAAAPDLQAVVKWGQLCFAYKGRSLLALALYRGHANLQCFNAADLELPLLTLEGSGRGPRHLRLRYGESLDASMIESLVRASRQRVQSRGLARPSPAP